MKSFAIIATVALAFGAAQGLAQARRIGHITYLSSEDMKRKFGREKKERDGVTQRFSTSFQIESYLDYQGTKFTGRFDANSYLHITEAMDMFDMAEGTDDTSRSTLPASASIIAGFEPL